MARKIKPGCPQQLMVIILKVIIVKYCAFPPPISTVYKLPRAGFVGGGKDCFSQEGPWALKKSSPRLSRTKG